MKNFKPLYLGSFNLSRDQAFSVLSCMTVVKHLEQHHDENAS